MPSVPHILALVEPFHHPLGEPKWELLGLLTITPPHPSFSGYRELGFDKVLFVEGATDIKTVQQLLRHYGKDHRIVCMDLGGNALINGHSGIELEESKRVPYASHLKRAGFDFCASPLRISMP